MNSLLMKIKKWENGKFNIENDYKKPFTKSQIFIESSIEHQNNPYPGYKFKDSIYGKGYYFDDCDKAVGDSGCGSGLDLHQVADSVCCKKNDNYTTGLSLHKSTGIVPGKDFLKLDYIKDMPGYEYREGSQGLGYYKDYKGANVLTSGQMLKSSNKKKNIFIKAGIEGKDQKIPGYIWKIGKKGPGFYLQFKNTKGELVTCDSEEPCTSDLNKFGQVNNIVVN